MDQTPKQPSSDQPHNHFEPDPKGHGLRLRPGIENCDQCGGPAAPRPLRPYPVVSQILFAGSFVVFILFFDDIAHNRPLIWSWSAIQFVLGVVLIRQRLRSRQRVFRCVRCGAILG